MNALSAVFIFAPTQVPVAEKIARLIRRDPPHHAGIICTSFEMIRTALADQPQSQRIAILLAGSCQELDLIVSAAPLFEDLPLILRLPDLRSDTIAKAHHLRPRYLIGPRIDYRALRTVIARLFFRQKSRSSAAAPINKPIGSAFSCRTQHFLQFARGQSICGSAKYRLRETRAVCPPSQRHRLKSSSILDDLIRTRPWKTLRRHQLKNRPWAISDEARAAGFAAYRKRNSEQE